MTNFASFLKSRFDADGFTTEDALASFLPLAREVLDAHAAGMVAPLEGLSELQVEGVRIWFEEAKRLPVRRARSKVRHVEQNSRSAVEVVSETRVTTEVDDGAEKVVNSGVCDPDKPITRPVYLPGYQSWEHRLECHDPLTDIFSLGMILASIACGLDFDDPEMLTTFESHRKNLFLLNEGLHPVVARVIVRMTEIDRSKRAQDLSSLVRTLESYRDQEVDFDFDLAHTKDFASSSKRDKQTVVLTKLRERLFEISRRNKLLHFRPTMQTVNLTQASVPLSFDIKNIRPDQILVWNEKLQKEVSVGKPLSLNKYLNFTEVLYLPSQLERLIAEARRDQAEFGFAQLRLVACFLHWANLKEKPIEQYESPLVLIPVQLKKKKGIRDTFYLEAMSSEAEINPVIRHQFKQLYDISLPESIDLASSDFSDLFENLSRQIAASESVVKLTKIDKPRISLIHEKARRRLDQYRRRARLAGRGIRKYLDLDYSYDPANYHPLGIKLFSAKVRPSQTHLREIIEEKPRPRSFATPDDAAPVAEKERQFYSLQSSSEANPYDWTFDLCSVTLANFKYRRMSLVRDYEALLEDGMTNPAFESVFSLSPRAIDTEPQDARAIDERFDVVPCDPTQASAIAEADLGKSFIIQGPPGTGKSQTITNLIADYVARGKSVLFVCEKRAAIDVVYARLKQCGLSELCCLIHDSQTDKKEFVMDLKHTYEGFLTPPNGDESPSQTRAAMVKKLKGSIDPLANFDKAMQATPDRMGVSVRQLIDQCIELRDLLPELDPIEKERLPDHDAWHKSKPAIARFEQALRETGGQSVLARHPMRILSARLASAERPLEIIADSASEGQKSCNLVEEHLSKCGVPRDQWEQFARARLLIDYSRRMKLIAEKDQIKLLNPQTEDAKWFEKQLKVVKRSQSHLQDAIDSNKNWQDKLAPEETQLALEQAVSFEASTFSWLKPSWWRLRGVLKKCYDFQAHKIRPRWSHVLEQLKQEHEAAAECENLKTTTAERLGLESDGVNSFVETMVGLSDWLPGQPRWLATIHTAILKSPKATQIISRVENVHSLFQDTELHLSSISDDVDKLTISELKHCLNHIIENLDSISDFLECLRELQSTPAEVPETLRSFEHTPTEIEAAVSHHSLDKVYRNEKHVERFNSAVHRRHTIRLEGSYDSWLGLNASSILDGVRKRFLERLHIAEQPAAKLSAEEKEFKRRYNRGRRELEHEFGKQMRFKAIRDLVAEESGDVVNDLKPVWLMSPLSVSDTLPLASDRFDVVIFDEASQITLEEAVPALFRAPQSIIVGDEMQLPPTDFFSAKQSSEEEEEMLIEADGELVQYDLDSGSFLSHAANNLSSTMLGWHYRSRSESLISFSNWAFYDGRLLTVPEESLAGVQRGAISANRAEDGAQAADETLRRPISYHSLEHGIYDKRRNRAEAEYIAEMVRSLLQDEAKLTIGIVAFSEAQQDEIEQALTRLSLDDKQFRDALEAEYEREEDGQFIGLLVKNLENIQGDERDIIILSVCYGHPPTGKMRMNFGPINKSGGEKRLNVAFSRAKKHMAIVSSIDSTDITNDYNDGANCLKSYLRYAEAVSTGDAATASRIMYGLSRWAQEESEEDSTSSDIVTSELAEALESAGYKVDREVGQSHFRCNLAVYSEGDQQYRLGILIDGASYYEQSDLMERDMMRPRLLRAFGWNVVHVFAKDWHSQREHVLSRLLAVIEGKDVVDDDSDIDEEELSGTEEQVHEEDLSLESELQITAEDPPQETNNSNSRRLEFHSDKSNKFWEISLSGSVHTVNFGRLGAGGQSRTKTFDDDSAARRDFDRLVREKLRKGYQDSPAADDSDR